MPANDHIDRMSSQEDISSTTTSRILASGCGGCGDGECVEPAISNLSTNTNFQPSSSSLSSAPSCDCKGTGYIGKNCEIKCSLDCQNGGKCIPAQENNNNEEESCSCTKAVVDGNPFAGLNCEYGATKSCMTMGSESKHSFCTNDGECSDIVGDNEQHRDCVCTAGFEGAYCEYIVGTAPAVGKALGAANESAQGKSTNDMVVFVMLIVVASLIGILLLAFGIRAKRRRDEAKRQERESRLATEQLSDLVARSEDEII